MFGALRLLLAVLVASLHMGWIRLGVQSVVVFYILSGYTMAHVLREKFGNDLRKAPSFYLDRVLRIYPVYLAFLALTALFVGVTGYAHAHFTPLAMVLNVLIAPLDYSPFIAKHINIVDGFWLIPPAWSLGLELHFYALAPFLARFRAVRAALVPASLAVFVLACTERIQPQIWGYILLPGVLFIFLSGMLLYRPGALERRMLALAYGTALALFFGYSHVHPLNPYVREVLEGYLVGFPVVVLLARVRVRSRLDTYLGGLSYPLFLAHFPSIWVVSWAMERFDWHPSFAGRTAAQFAIAFGTAWLGYQVVERKTQEFRRSVRARLTERRRAAADAAPAGATAAGTTEPELVSTRV